METLYLLALLACPVGMGAMMWFMMRGKNHSSKEASERSPGHIRDEEVTRLRAEVDQLRAATQDTGAVRRDEERT